MVVSLTTTPMMCAYVLRPHQRRGTPGRFFRWSERGFDAPCSAGTATACAWSLRHPLTTMLVFLATVILNIYLYVTIPKGFFPQQDTGRIVGGIRADQSISFQAMRRKFRQFMEIVRQDPAVESVAGFTGGFSTNSGFVFATLKPLQRAQDVGRPGDRPPAGPSSPRCRAPTCSWRPCRTSASAAARAMPSTSSPCRPIRCPTSIPGRPSWWRRLRQDASVITDVNSDQQQRGLQVNLTIDRDTAARLGVSTRAISSTLYDAFGQRQVSTIYNALNQYHVVMEVAPEYWESPERLKDIYVSTTGGAISGAPGDRRRRLDRRRCAAGAVDPSQAVRNQRTNAIAVSGRGSASTGAAVSTTPETMIPLSRSPSTSSARRRLPSITRACSSPARSPSTWCRARRSQRRGRLRESHHARDRHAGHHPRLVPGHGARLPAEF